MGSLSRSATSGVRAATDEAPSEAEMMLMLLGLSDGRS